MPAMGHAVLPDHILAAVLAIAKRELNRDRFAFRGHDFQLQEIFSELQKSKKYPILDAFVFSDSGPGALQPRAQRVGLEASIVRLDRTREP